MPPDADLWCEAEERAALREVVGGQRRADAEASTVAELIGLHGRAPEGWLVPLARLGSTGGPGLNSDRLARSGTCGREGEGS